MPWKIQPIRILEIIIQEMLSVSVTNTKAYATVPLKSKLPPLVLFLTRGVSFLSRSFLFLLRGISFLSRITEDVLSFLTSYRKEVLASFRIQVQATLKKLQEVAGLLTQKEVLIIHTWNTCIADENENHVYHTNWYDMIQML